MQKVCLDEFLSEKLEFKNCEFLKDYLALQVSVILQRELDKKGKLCLRYYY